MTPTRWAIAAFWIFMAVLGVYYAVHDVMLPAPPPPPPPQQGLLPALPGPAAPAAAAPNAEVKLTHYATHITPGALEFSVDVTLQNVGSKKATGVQVMVHPYVGNQDTNKSQMGPDEIPGQQGGDPLHNVVQNLDYPDIDPGQTATQSFTLPVRSDADPAQRDDSAQVIFQTAP
jgi:hypothetical protein